MPGHVLATLRPTEPDWYLPSLLGPLGRFLLGGGLTLDVVFRLALYVVRVEGVGARACGARREGALGALPACRRGLEPVEPSGLPLYGSRSLRYSVRPMSSPSVKAEAPQLLAAWRRLWGALRGLVAAGVGADRSHQSSLPRPGVGRQWSVGWSRGA
jgi:hypothetical protein